MDTHLQHHHYQGVKNEADKVGDRVHLHVVSIGINAEAASVNVHHACILKHTCNRADKYKKAANDKQ
ncbi:MAG TPA: hypothetical protein VN698_16275 [Bacteroidia bacterium]|nr:hypothetical protein [Bacteroidia bacterium]